MIRFLYLGLHYIHLRHYNHKFRVYFVCSNPLKTKSHTENIKLLVSSVIKEALEKHIFVVPVHIIHFVPNYYPDCDRPQPTSQLAINRQKLLVHQQPPTYYYISKGPTHISECFRFHPVTTCLVKMIKCTPLNTFITCNDATKIF